MNSTQRVGRIVDDRFPELLFILSLGMVGIVFAASSPWWSYIMPSVAVGYSALTILRVRC